MLVIHWELLCSWFKDAEELLEKLNIPRVEELLERLDIPGNERATLFPEEDLIFSNNTIIQDKVQATITFTFCHSFSLCYRRNVMEVDNFTSL